MVSLIFELVVFFCIGLKESLQDASVWNLKRKLLTLGRQTAFH